MCVSTHTSNDILNTWSLTSTMMARRKFNTSRKSTRRYSTVNVAISRESVQPSWNSPGNICLKYVRMKVASGMGMEWVWAFELPNKSSNSVCSVVSKSAYCSYSDLWGKNINICKIEYMIGSQARRAVQTYPKRHVPIPAKHNMRMVVSIAVWKRSSCAKVCAW